MFLTKRQLRSLTGIPATEPERQLAYLNERGIRNFGINAAGRLIVPCSVIDAPTAAPASPTWTPDFSKVQ